MRKSILMIALSAVCLFTAGMASASEDAEGSKEITFQQEAEEQLEKEIAQMQEDFKTREAAYQEAARVMDEYNAAFGEKGLRADKIDELIAIMQEGKASTIQEALNVQKNK